VGRRRNYSWSCAGSTGKLKCND